MRTTATTIALILTAAACGSSASSITADRDADTIHVGDAGPLGDAAPTSDGGSPDGATTSPDGSVVVPPKQGDVNVSGSRLKMRGYVASDGAKQFVSWHDDQLNVDCDFRTTSDGMLRCTPSGANVLGYFSDTGCSQPLAIASPKGCAAPPYGIEFYQATGVCNSSRVRVRPIGSAFTGATMYSGTPGNCNGTPSSSLLSIYDMYSVGPEVAPSTYVSATLQPL